MRAVVLLLLVVLAALSQALPLRDHPWKQTTQDSWRFFIMFQHNLPMLQQAIRSYRDASKIMTPNMIIIDNSVGYEAEADLFVSTTVREVVRSTDRLNFPQLHNFMAKLALERRLEFYFWAHSDNYVLPKDEDSDLGVDALDCLINHFSNPAPWAGVFFAYDHLAVFSTRALIQVPWDPNVFQYGSDCDSYGRLRAAKYKFYSCKVHQSFDMARVIDILPTDSYAEKLVKLVAEGAVKQKRNQWREGQMSRAEIESRTQMKLASREYLKIKWGDLTCALKGLECRRPWPFCPTKAVLIDPSWAQLDGVSAMVDDIFAHDEHRPITPAL
eukprot:m.64038 g.64038  ORF g.64038 m.64038 type:complete len:328 (+) comp49697_c0_seq2:828-1811(+)